MQYLDSSNAYTIVIAESEDRKGQGLFYYRYTVSTGQNKVTW